MPGSSDSGRSCESRWVRFRIPRVTSPDRPSGATSQSLAGRTPRDARRDAELHRTAHDLELLLDGPVVDEGERLVGTLVPRQPERLHAGAPDRSGDADVAPDREPVDAGLRSVRGPRPRRERPRSSASRAGGHAGSARHSPFAVSRSGSGSLHRRTKIEIGGPTSTEGSSPSHRCHQAIITGTWSIRGPGIDSRAHVAPRPEQDRFRAAEPLEGRNAMFRYPSAWPAITSVAAWIASASSNHTDARRQYASPRLMLEPVQDPRLVRLDPAMPLLPPPLPVDRRDRRQRVQRHHVRRVVEEVDAAAHAAVVDVVGVAPIGRVDRDDRLQRRRPERGHLEAVEARVGRRTSRRCRSTTPAPRATRSSRRGPGAPGPCTRPRPRPPTTRSRGRRRGTRRGRLRRRTAGRSPSRRRSRPSGTAAPRTRRATAAACPEVRLTAIRTPSSISRNRRSSGIAPNATRAGRAAMTADQRV